MIRIAAAIALLCIANIAAAEWGVAQLFERLSRERPAKAAFHEKKYLSLLDKPVESSGELTFTPPDRLEKRTISPKAERVTVDRDRVSLERGGRTHSLALRENPAIAVLVESIRGTLAGDLAALTRNYSVGLEGAEAAWKLRLRPLDPALASLADRIEIAGSQAQVRTVEIFLADGDRSVMTITPAAK